MNLNWESTNVELNEYVNLCPSVPEILQVFASKTPGERSHTTGIFILKRLVTIKFYYSFQNIIVLPLL